MPSYSIEHKVDTVAHLWKPEEIRGFQFSPWHDDGVTSRPWLVTRTASATDWRAALTAFYADLLPVVDALSVLTRCAFWTGGQSCLLRRLDNNPTNDFYVNVAYESKSVGIPYWSDDQKEDLNKLLGATEIQGALHYLRVASDTRSPKTRLAMLVIAAEAVAGTGETKGHCSQCGHEYSYNGTNKELLKVVLGDESYDALYRKKGGSLRHKLFHGEAVSDQDLGTLPNEMYSAIWAYLKSSLGLESLDDEVVNVPRTLGGSRGLYGFFLRPKDDQEWDLRSVEDAFDLPRHVPEGLKILAPPTDY